MCFILFITSGYAQVAISDGANPDPDPASVLDLQSSSKGFLIPRMTEAQKNAITSPPTGLMVFQTDGAKGFYYNSGTAASPDWNMITDEDNGGSGGGYWTQSGSDIYYNTGYVGIGTDAPGTMLDVQGPGWFHDSIAVHGNPALVHLNASAGIEPAIRFAEDGNMAFKLRYSIGGNAFGDEYLMLNSNLFENIWGVTNYGRVRQDYKGSFQAHLIYSAAPRSALFIENTNGQAEARGLNVSITNSSSNSLSVALTAFNSGNGSAFYGGNTGNGNYAYIGTDQYGVYGQNDNGNWSALGTESSAVFASLGDGTSAQTLANGDYAVKGRGVYDAGFAGGTDYAYNATVGGVLGHNPYGAPYTFGVAGYASSTNAKRSGAVLGSLTDGSVWGALAYRADKNPVTHYGGYFTSAELNGTDNASSSPTYTNIGIGAWGDLMGAGIYGNVYGLYTQGNDYSLYANGDVYRTGADVHLQENASGENTVMYTLVSTEMVVQTYGVGQMVKGKAGIVFDQAFADVVSPDEPIIVTISPIGKSNGVYLDKVDAEGFSVAENSNGKSSVQFNWIAIGKRKGFENKVLPEDVIAPDYNERINNGIANDNNPDAKSEGLYYQNGKLHNGNALQNRAAAPANVEKSPQALQPQQSERVENKDIEGGEN